MPKSGFFLPKPRLYVPWLADLRCVRAFARRRWIWWITSLHQANVCWCNHSTMQWLRNWACYIQSRIDETASHTSQLSGLISSLNSPSRLYWEAVLAVTRHTKDWTHDLLMTSPTLYLLRHSATSSVTKRHQLVPVKRRRHCLVGKVTVGLASCWPCISDLSGIHLQAKGLRKWDAHPAYTPPMSVTYPLPLHINLKASSLHHQILNIIVKANILACHTTSHADTMFTWTVEACEFLIARRQLVRHSSTIHMTKKQQSQ